LRVPIPGERIRYRVSCYQWIANEFCKIEKGKILKKKKIGIPNWAKGVPEEELLFSIYEFEIESERFKKERWEKWNKKLKGIFEMPKVIG